MIRSQPSKPKGTIISTRLRNPWEIRLKILIGLAIVAMSGYSLYFQIQLGAVYHEISLLEQQFFLPPSSETSQQQQQQQQQDIADAEIEAMIAAAETTEDQTITITTATTKTTTESKESTRKRAEATPKITTAVAAVAAATTQAELTNFDEEPESLNSHNHQKFDSFSIVEDVAVAGIRGTQGTTDLRQPQARGRLRHNWANHPPRSDLAKRIEAHQSDCSLPVHTHHLDNAFGIGAHLALWSQGMCNAMEQGPARFRTSNPDWLWLDQTLCDKEEAAEQSPLLCYLPKAEFRCDQDKQAPLPNINVTDPRNDRLEQCSLLDRDNMKGISEFRAATTEYLFQSVSPLVIAEAERQVGVLFGNDNGTPDDLITVHMRWGDKFWEMKLATIEEYKDAVSKLLMENFGQDKTANIYLATEDPRAAEKFQKAVPPGWNVYYDVTVDELKNFRPLKGNRASHMSINTKGRAGLVAFGSLLVAMESKYFVLTTGSNWSRLMNHLRTNVIDPRHHHTTKMIDLRPGEW